MHRSDSRPLLSLAAAAALLFGSLGPAARRAPAFAFDTAAQQAAAALDAGRALLRRNRADEALPRLEAALELYARANDPTGAAAARDALGDIYLRHGQHAAALRHFEPAYAAFRAANDCPNAALVAVKIGETHYLAGDAEAASAAFARAHECGERGGAGVVGAGGADGERARRRGVGFALVSASLPSLASCAALGPNQLASNAAEAASVLAAAGGSAAVVAAAAGSGGTPAPTSNPPGRVPANNNPGAQGRPAPNNPGTNSPRPNNAGSSNAGTNSAGTNNPGANSPRTNSPGANNPGSNNLGSNKPSGNNPSGNNAPGQNAPGNNAANNPAGNNAANNNPAGNNAANGRPAGNNSANGKPSGNNQPGNNQPGNNSPGNNAANNSPNSPPNEPASRARAPKKLDDLGRMDLRVTDANGNPLSGVRARLSTTRPNGIFCDCWETTDATGRAVMPAIHVGKKLLLELEKKGFEPQKVTVEPQELGQPFRVKLLPKGVSFHRPARHSDLRGELSHALSPAPPASVAAQAAPGQCLALYRGFVAYGFAQLGAARADFAAGRLDSARAHYENVLAVSGADTPSGALAAARLFRAVARTSLGDVALRQGRFADAASLYSQAAAGARRDGRPELAWAAQRGLARSLWSLAASHPQPQSPTAAKQREESLQTYRDALSTVETLFAGSLRADEARAHFLSTTRDLFDDAASAFAESALAAQGPARGGAYRVGAHAYQPGQRPLEGGALAYAAEAFRVAEQGRARSLLDLLGESRAEITEGLPAELVARRAANRARQQEIADLLRGVLPAAEAARAQSIAQLEAELERLSVEHDSVENQMRTASGRYGALVRAQPLSLAEVQRQVLDDETALVEYALGRERSYLFALTRAGLIVERLPARAEVERQAMELRRQLIPAGLRREIAGVDVTRGIGGDADAGRGLGAGNAAAAPQAVAAYAAAAHALYRTALAPVAAFVGARRLLVVADGALSFVPFEALVTAPGGADYASLNYLVNTHEVAYAPSASVVAALRRQPRAAAGRGGMLVVADPVFDAADARARGRTLRTKEAAAQRASLQSAIEDVTGLKQPGLKLARLAGTRAEAEQIAALARAQGGAADLWLDFDASEANLARRRLDNYRVLHFATHGLLDAERPRFTGLALSLVGDADADGFLRVEEVFNLRLGTPLVMLSACETGLGREQRGEGVIGLTRAFMYAGAPTVGVSLWSVADKSTAELMPDFYRRLLASGGRGTSAALRAAQRQMIANKKYSAPFHWAAFVLVGDWQ